MRLRLQHLVLSIMLLFTSGLAAQFAITVEKPLFGWDVLPTATRRVHANVTIGGTQCTVGTYTCAVTWTINSDGSGGASLVPAASPNVSGAWADITVGPIGGTCSPVTTCVTGSSASPTLTSSSVVSITATSVDSPSTSVTFPLVVYAPDSVGVYISPFNSRVYQGQTVDLQSWVWGSVNDNVNWSITQPSGGNGAFIAPPAGGSSSTARDALFSATVAGDYTITATAVGAYPFPNLQALGSSGWTLTGGTSTSGGSNTGSPSVTYNASPNLSGGSIALTSNGNGYNTQLYTALPNAAFPSSSPLSMTDVTVDTQVYIPTGSTLLALEGPNVPMYNGSYEMYPSIQADSVSGFWKIWNGTSWVSTGVSCTAFLANTNAWQHMVVHYGFNSASHTFTYYSLTVNGTVIWTNQGTFTGITNAGSVALKTQVQVDNTSGATATTVYFDQINTYATNASVSSATAIVSVSSNSMPSYSITPNHTRPVDCSVNPASGNTVYDVGPTGHTYTSIAAVFTAHSSAWNGASGYPVEPSGTTIQLWNTDTTGTNPTRYHEYLRLDGQGTLTAPIRIVGCADSAGNLPIMDASNATAYSSTDNSVAASIGGLYQIGFHHSGAAAGYPTILSPSYIIIEGIAFRNAYPTIQPAGTVNSYYYNPGSGSQTQWGTSTSCIRPYEGNHVTVRGNDMQDCSFGILADFNASSDGWGGFFGDFDLEGNYFNNIGASNESEHMAYVQGFRQVIQGNYFDQLKSVSGSGMLKMRGVGEVVRYNWFNQSTNTRTIDFVEEQDSNVYMSTLGYFYTPSGGTSFYNGGSVSGDTYTPNLLVAGDEAWHKAYAYGNVINMGPGVPPSQAPIHFFGDQSPYSDENTNPPVRVGDLFDYSNSFFFASGTGGGGPPNFNFIDTMENEDNQIRWEWPVLTIANNAIFTNSFNLSSNQGFQWSTTRADIYKFGNNWISSPWGTNTQTCTNSGCWAGTGWPWYEETTQYMDGGNLPAHISGFSSVTVGGTTAPFSTTTFVPTTSGPLVGTGATLPSSVTNMPVRSQINSNYTLTPRTRPLDLGAIDGSGSSTPTAASPTFSPAAGSYSSTQSITISHTTGSVVCYNTTGAPATNGTTGCTTGTLYSGAVAVSASETLYAVAGGTGYLDSSIPSAAYTIGSTPTAGTPTYSPVAGTYSSTQTVTINHSTGGVVCYTTNGTTPATNGASGCTTGSLYSTPLIISSTTTIKSVAGGTGYLDSTVGTAVFTISGAPVVAPIGVFLGNGVIIR